MIFTSNVGTEEAEALRHRIGFAHDAPGRAEVIEEFSRALKTNFRPEFVNRLTDVVFFNPIGLDECERIAELFLEKVRKHAAGIPLRLQFEKPVPRWLAEKSFRPEYGARELRRTVEMEVEGALSDMLIEGHVDRGDSVTVKVSRDRLHFQRN
jgi:ATP-dependent Clp protease ATP-binding subunit ClpC